MAVDLTKNPWIIPAADAGTTVLSRDLIRVEAVRWFGSDIAIGDECTLKDKNGRVFWSVNADTAKEGDEFRFGNDFNIDGFIAAVISHGTVHLYLL